jgi:hypothetical protein
VQFFLDTIVVCSLIAIAIGVWECVLWLRIRSRERVEQALERAELEPEEAREPVRPAGR